MEWQDALKAHKQSEYFQKILANVQYQRDQGAIIYPPASQIFNAFKQCPFSRLKVVILGQDPYHNPGQAHGLSFSVPDGVAFPPSLANIFKTLSNDLSLPIPSTGNLTPWAQQGVFLLNTVLTVIHKKPHSHATIGWQHFTDAVIDIISQFKDHVVFMLWGGQAQKKRQFIDQTKHTVLTAPHPSPLSAYRGFFDCQHFSKCNDSLTQHGQTPINWQL